MRNRANNLTNAPTTSKSSLTHAFGRRRRAKRRLLCGSGAANPTLGVSYDHVKLFLDRSDDRMISPDRRVLFVVDSNQSNDDSRTVKVNSGGDCSRAPTR
jgi:hypothetical protein